MVATEVYAVFDNGQETKIDPAKVEIYAGVFGGTGKGLLALDGFNVYDHSDVVFGAHTTSSSPYKTAAEYQNAIRVYAQNANIATNKITNGEVSAVALTVKIYYGSYTYQDANNTSSNTGIWADNGKPIAYNTSRNYTLVKGSYSTGGNGMYNS